MVHDRQRMHSEISRSRDGVASIKLVPSMFDDEGLANMWPDNQLRFATGCTATIPNRKPRSKAGQYLRLRMRG